MTVPNRKQLSVRIAETYYDEVPNGESREPGQETEQDYMGWRGFLAYIAAIVLCAVAWGFILGRMFSHAR